MKKRLFLMPLLILSLLTFSACNDNKNNNDKVDNETLPQETKENDTVIKDKNGNQLLKLDNNYYKSMGGTLNSKEEFKDNLHELLETTHTKRLTYKEVWTALESLDEDPNNKNNVLCFYSGQSLLKTNHVGSSGQAGYWNREHLFPQSRGFNSNNAVAHNDIFHIRATDYVVNSNRKDTDFGEGSDYYEPRDEIKGDIARALLYMVVRYNEDDYSSYNGITDSDDLDLELIEGKSSTAKTANNEYVVGNLKVLIKWNYLDPVSAEESLRNEKAYGIQHNRNPFIDYNDFVAYLYPSIAKDYTDITKIEYLM